ncbi:TonB-dependent receptor [Novosphingobium lentum]|uniref:TonB-dependent receptor n=1 Tax=Novosphingobium lentum TaxID=145287 RepID=UPI0008326785|nr:TonB-dependent receptor [Novosphingobium lentum]
MANIRQLSLSASLIVLAQVWSTQALAQQQPADATANASDNNGEIVVTAQKRAQSTTDVGLSIVSVGNEELSRKGIESAQDLVKIVPGLSVSDAGNGATVVYTLRGIGFNSSNLGATSAVAVYVDEVPLSYPVMSLGVGIDLQRVEVYKGPQGTVFGQNSTGGAINYIANKPTDTLTAGIEGTFGRFNRWGVQGYVSGPVSDNLRLRLALSQEGGGPWQQSYTRNDQLGRRDRTFGRFLGQLDVTDAIKVNFGVNAWRDRSDTQALQLIRYAPLQPPGLPQVASYPTAPADSRAADWDPQGRFSGTNKKFQFDSWFVQPFLRVDAELSDKVTLTSLSTYSHYNTNSLFDDDGTAFEIGEINQFGHIKEFSQELRLSGQSGIANWVVGANYQTNKIAENLNILILNLSNVQNIGGSGFSAHISPITTRQDTDAKAIFGNLELKFSDKFSFVAGARYTKTNIDFAGCNLDSGPPIPNSPTPGVTSSLRGFFNILYGLLTGNAGANPIQEGGCITLDNVSRNGAPPTFLPTDSAQTLSEHNVSWNVTANFKPSPDTLLYARVSKGYKSGSFPTIGASTSIQFQPARQESLLAYEAGFKLSALNRHVRLEGAGFYYDYKNKQLSNFIPDAVFGPLVATVNIPKSRVIGAELSASVIPVDGLTLSGGVTYIDTKITQFVGFDVDGVSRNLAGQRFNLAPKWSGSAGAAYEFPLNAKLSGFVGSDVTFRSSTQGVIGATSSDYNIDSYATVDAQLGVVSSDGWRVQLWGKNIFNKYYWTNVNRISDTIVRVAGMPSTYGVTVAKKF